MEDLPASVISRVCSFLPQQDLASLASTCRFLHPIAMAALYEKVSVVLGARRPTFPLAGNQKEFVRELSGGRTGSLVLDVESAERLLRTLEETPAGRLIRDFSFENGTDKDLLVLQKRLSLVLEDSVALRSFHMEPELPYSGLNVRRGLFHSVEASMDGFCRAVGSYSSSVSVCLTRPPTACVSLPSTHALQHMSCDSAQNHGLQVLQALEPLSLDDKLQLESLSISHLHEDGSNERLHLASVASAVNIPHLSCLKLNVDCHQPDCFCFSVFMASLAEFSAQNGGLPKLARVEIEAFPQEDWLRPVEMLERVLEPVSNFLKGLTGLTSLKIDLATPSLKMTGDRETSISDANKINRRLIDAFFLSMFEVPDFGARLQRLELPDFLASFAYYKSDFMGSMLHSCSCSGCNNVLSKLSKEIMPEIISDDEEVDESQAYYLVMYAFLRRSQNQELLQLKDNGRFHQSLLKIDHGDWLADHFGNCTISDSAVKTYIVHQLRPIEEYFSGIFENLQCLNLHGVYFEKLGDHMVSVFQNQTYM